MVFKMEGWIPSSEKEGSALSVSSLSFLDAERWTCAVFFIDEPLEGRVDVNAEEN